VTIQSQTVTLTRLADRHATLHGRAFAETREIVVGAGALSDVLAQAARATDLPLGRYSITVSEPWDSE